MSRRKGRATTETAGVAPVNFPVGCVLPFAGTAAPDGWLLCDGSLVSRTSYAGLYATIGDAHGNGDGSTTFHVPDLRGRFVRGVDGIANRDPDKAGRTAANAGGNTGNAVGSAQDDAMQAITGSVTTGNASGIRGVFNNAGAGAITTSHTSGSTSLDFGSGGSTTSSWRSTLSFNSANSSGARTSAESRPSNVNLNHIIKI